MPVGSNGAMTEGRDGRRDLWVLVGVSVVATALAAYPTLRQALLGWDAYPAIAGSRITSWSDLVGVFTEPFMDGLHPTASFYRPLTALSLALDHALYGLNATGYHVTTLLLHATAATLLGVWLRDLFGSLAPVALAAALFAVHPAHVETLAYIARRGDVIALVFGLAALVAGERRRPGLAALLIVLAALGKETGLLFAVPLLHRSLRDESLRLRTAIWLAAGAIPYVAARSEILVGTGGYAGAAGGEGGVVAFLARTVESHVGTSSAANVMGWIAPEMLLGLLALAVAAPALARVRRFRWPQSLLGAPAVIGVSWCVLVGVPALLAPVWSPWYAYAPVALVCAALAGAAASAARALRHERSRVGLTEDLIGLGAIAVLALTWITATLDPAEDRRLDVASAAERIALVSVDEQVALGPGQRDGMDPQAASLVDFDGREVLILAPYSIDAYALLAHPAVIVRARHPSEAPTPDGTDVEVTFRGEQFFIRN